MDISVVIPLFNEEESIAELYDWIVRVMEANGFSFEVIFVDDGSTDGSWDILERISERDDRCKAIHFRRNHGKSAGLNVGFQSAQGKVVITLDADLQDSPDEIPEFYRMIIQDRYDLVSGWKKKRYDPITKTIPTKLFNWATRKMSDIKLHDFNCGLKAYRLEVVKAVDVHGEMHRYIPFLAKNLGFVRIGEKVVQHQPRKYGYSKFGLERFINGYLDLLTLAFISRFAKRPMHFFGLYGTLTFTIGFILVVYLGVEKLMALRAGDSARLIADNAWFYIALTTMIIGTLLFLSGFLAELIIRNSGRRTEYTVDQKLNLEVQPDITNV
jgi:glycosyltransferase involved in cell wall biosynthesis